MKRLNLTAPLLGVVLSLSNIDSASAFNAQSFRFSHSFETVMIEDAMHSKHTHLNEEHPWMFGASYNYVQNPLIVVSEDGGRFVDSLIRNYQTFDFIFTRRMEITSELISHLQIRGAWNNLELNGQGVSSFGDTEIGMKFKIKETKRSAFAITPFINLPTGDVDEFTGDDSIGTGILGSYEYHLGPHHFYFNLGYRYAKRARFRNINLSSRIISGVGYIYDITSKWAVNLETKGEFGTNFDPDQNPSDILANLKYKVNPSLNLFAGGGIGGINFQGEDNTDSNDYRALIGFKWSPREKLRKVEKIKYVEREKVLQQKLLILKEVKFNLNKDTLTARSEVILEIVADALKEFDRYIRKIIVEGHTDSRAPADYNKDLSERRAKTVVKFLISKGVKATKLYSIGYGETRPKVTPEKSEADYLRNRRVEFKIKFKKTKKVLRSKE